MTSDFEKFENLVRQELESPDWAIDYLKSGLPADLNLDDALSVEVFKKYFYVERPQDEDLDRRIKDLFTDPKHNMLCIESGRGSGKSTFIQTLHLYDEEHTYERLCIDFSQKDDYALNPEYSYCENKLFQYFKKRYRQACKNSKWIAEYDELYDGLLKKFPSKRQSIDYMPTLAEVRQYTNIDDYENAFPGHRARIEKVKDCDLRVILLLYILLCISEPSAQNKRWFLIFDSIEVYVESSAKKWVKAIATIADFIRAALNSIRKDEEFFTRFTAIFPIRTATSISFSSYSNPALFQGRPLWGTGNEYIFPLERFDFASQALIKKLQYLKTIGGDKTPLFMRCMTIGSLLLPRHYIEAALEQPDLAPNPAFKIFTKTRLMPLFNYDFRKVMDRLYYISAAEDKMCNIFRALDSIHANAKGTGITQEFAANGENMITTRLIINALQEFSPNLFSEIGYLNFDSNHEPSIARAMFNFLYYSELKYYLENAPQDEWGGEYPGVPFKDLLNKLRPFSNKQISSIAKILYKSSVVIGDEREYSYVNIGWSNLIVIKGLKTHISFSNFQTIVRDYYSQKNKAAEDDEDSELLKCSVLLSDAGRCFTVWLSKQYEFLLARSSSFYYTDPLFVYSTKNAEIKECLEKPFEKARDIILHVSIEKLVAGCLQGCIYCHNDSTQTERINCVFFDRKTRKSFLDCSLFQRYQECLMIIVDSIDYIDRFRIYVWQVACNNGNENELRPVNEWLLDEMLKFHDLFKDLKNKVEIEFGNQRKSNDFFARMNSISQECKGKLSIKDIDRATKPKKMLQYHERLRLPRTTLWYTENDALIAEAIKQLKIEPNCQLYTKLINMLDSSPKEENIPVPMNEGDEPYLDGANINEQLIIWAESSDLYKYAVGPFDDTLKLALCGEETERILNSYILMEKIWRKYPWLGIMPDYKTLSQFEFGGQYYTKYRDHFAHMLKVFLLGLFLYEKSSRLKESFYGKRFTDESFVSTWTITALYHDIGYVFDTLDNKLDGNNINQACKNMLDLLQHPLHRLFPELFSENQETQLQKDYYVYPCPGCVLQDIKKHLGSFNGFGTSVNLCDSSQKCINPLKDYYDMVAGPNSDRSYYDHGISSAIILLFSNQVLKEYVTRMHHEISCAPDEQQNTSESFRQQIAKIAEIKESLDALNEYSDKASLALALHNITHEHSEIFINNLLSTGVTIQQFRISLSQEPLAYLLRLCDELQCWDRPYQASPIETGMYLKGQEVKIIKKNEHPAVCITDNDTIKKICKALDGLGDPGADEWLNN